MKPQIINIVNFVRDIEPRNKSINLYDATANQIKLLKENNLPAAFLLQYDALIDEKYINLFKQELDENYEIGIWLETVKPLIEKSGIKWRGRAGFPWDWHADVGFSVGYTRDERIKIVDTFMKDFKSIFGNYPRFAGSWIIDSFTLNYMVKKYGIKASCSCRDQWGTDGYTLWGGYYSQCYYPSCENVFCPAETAENQIDVPVFRMLGSDPIYQYDAGLIENGNIERCDNQPVYTLEPSNEITGANESWIDWFMKENFNGLCLSFGYAQTGQENSFGWEAMADGYKKQIKIISEKLKNNEIRVETLVNTANWFHSKYKLTPPSSIAALSDWQHKGRKSIWYCSRFYRVNLFIDENSFWVRDIYKFDEKYKERYLNNICTENNFIYDNLPVCDGSRWSGSGTRAGIYPYAVSGGKLDVIKVTAREVNDRELEVLLNLKSGENFLILCSEKKISLSLIKSEKNIDFELKLDFDSDVNEISGIEGNSILYMHNNYSYSVKLRADNVISSSKNCISIKSCKGKVGIEF